MVQKQIVTRTQIAKMPGKDATHFLNSRAGCVKNHLVIVPGFKHSVFI